MTGLNLETFLRIAPGRPGGLGEPGRRRGDPGRDDLDELGIEAGAPQVPVPVDRRPRRPDRLWRLVARDPQGPPARPGLQEAGTGRAAGPDHAGRGRAVDDGPRRASDGEEGGRLGPRPRAARPGRARPDWSPPRRRLRGPSLDRVEPGSLANPSVAPEVQTADLRARSPRNGRRASDPRVPRRASRRRTLRRSRRRSRRSADSPSVPPPSMSRPVRADLGPTRAAPGRSRPPDPSLPDPPKVDLAGSQGRPFGRASRRPTASKVDAPATSAAEDLDPGPPVAPSPVVTPVARRRLARAGHPTGARGRLAKPASIGRTPRPRPGPADGSTPDGAGEGHADRPAERPDPAEADRPAVAVGRPAGLSVAARPQPDRPGPAGRRDPGQRAGGRAGPRLARQAPGRRRPLGRRDRPVPRRERRRERRLVHDPLPGRRGLLRRVLLLGGRHRPDRPRRCWPTSGRATPTSTASTPRWSPRGSNSCSGRRSPTATSGARAWPSGCTATRWRPWPSARPTP